MVLETDLQRRNLSRRYADSIILLLVVAGVIGSKVHHALEDPSGLATDPVGKLFSPHGYAWFGGLMAGTITLCFLARRYRIPTLILMDVCSPAAALGYSIGRLGCLLSGDGDYGIATSLPWGMSFPQGTVPTLEYVHPTPVYEFLAGLAIFYYLRRLTRKQLPYGHLLAQYLMLSGVARFLVEFIRLNRRSLFGITDAQAISLICIMAGIILIGFVSSPIRYHDSAKEPL